MSNRPSLGSLSSKGWGKRRERGHFATLSCGIVISLVLRAQLGAGAGPGKGFVGAASMQVWVWCVSAQAVEPSVSLQGCSTMTELHASPGRSLISRIH